MRPEDRDLLNEALAHLKHVGVTVPETSCGADDFQDALLHLRVADRTYAYDVQIKRKISPASALVSRSSPGRGMLLVAPHVSDKVGEALRQHGVHYVDSVGNMYLQGDGLLLDVRGRRGPRTASPGSPGQTLRAFKPSGLKVVFVLLADPDLITASYREIAQASGVSLGTVHWVLNELEVGGYATAAPRRLYRTRNLFERWVDAYTFNLWPRLVLARFDAINPVWWTGADDALRAADAQWGGESAAHHLNPRLRPERAVVYAPDVPKKLAVEYRFRKAEGQGGVEVRHRFWHFPADSSLTVPTPLIYADLAASADPRLTEAATDLRESDALLQRLDRG